MNPVALGEPDRHFSCVTDLGIELNSSWHAAEIGDWDASHHVPAVIRDFIAPVSRERRAGVGNRDRDEFHGF